MNRSEYYDDDDEDTHLYSMYAIPITIEINSLVTEKGGRGRGEYNSRNYNVEIHMHCDFVII